MSCHHKENAGKVVIVTGAGSGIGAATALRFARDGYHVVLNGRTASKLDKIAAQIDDIYAQQAANQADAKPACLVYAGDVSKPSDVAGLIDASITTFGQIDVLVNNAAIAVMGGIEDVSYEDWSTQMDINAGSIFLTIKAALPYLEKTKGNVVNVSSVSGLGGDWGLFSYNATKGAVSNVTRALAMDLGASKGIRVNAVAPSLTVTDMTADIIENKDMMDKFAERMPLGRAAYPEEIADVIAFLAGHDARFVNGVVLPVDGGVNASNGQPKIM